MYRPRSWPSLHNASSQHIVSTLRVKNLYLKSRYSAQFLGISYSNICAKYHWIDDFHSGGGIKIQIHRRGILLIARTWRDLGLSAPCSEEPAGARAKTGKITRPEQVPKVPDDILGLLDGRRYVPQASDIRLLSGILFTFLGDHVVIQKEPQGLTWGEEALR